MIRLILVCLWILLFLVILGIPYLLILWLLSVFSVSLRDKLTMRYVVFMTRGITALAGEKIVASGTENIPSDTNVLFVSNHRSFFDIFTAFRFFKGCCGCVAKIEWMRIPVLREWMDYLHCVFLDRSNTRAGLKASAKVVEELKSGRNFWVCPEGTRNHSDDLLPFREGSFRAAFQAGKPIIPITITHTDDVFEKHIPFVRPQTVYIHFGKPIPTEGLDKQQQKELVARIRNEIQCKYNELL